MSNTKKTTEADIMAAHASAVHALDKLAQLVKDRASRVQSVASRTQNLADELREATMGAPMTNAEALRFDPAEFNRRILDDIKKRHAKPEQDNVAEAIAKHFGSGEAAEIIKRQIDKAFATSDEVTPKQTRTEGIADPAEFAKKILGIDIGAECKSAYAVVRDGKCEGTFDTAEEAMDFVKTLADRGVPAGYEVYCDEVNDAYYANAAGHTTIGGPFPLRASAVKCCNDHLDDVMKRGYSIMRTNGAWYVTLHGKKIDGPHLTKLEAAKACISMAHDARVQTAIPDPTPAPAPAPETDPAPKLPDGYTLAKDGRDRWYAWHGLHEVSGACATRDGAMKAAWNHHFAVTASRTH